MPMLGIIVGRVVRGNVFAGRIPVFAATRQISSSPYLCFPRVQSRFRGGGEEHGSEEKAGTKEPPRWRAWLKRVFWGFVSNPGWWAIALGFELYWEGFYIGSSRARTRWTNNDHTWVARSLDEAGDVVDEKASQRIPNATGYQELKNEFESRVLVLHPGHPGQPIECSLKQVNIINAPRETQYEALSYVWGDPKDQKRLMCDGMPKLVTKNLYGALDSLRHPEECRSLWVDALCINQANEKEKTQQVRMMGEIYARSRRVLIWLGAEEASERALKTLLSDSQLGADDRQTIRALVTKPWLTRVWCIQELIRARDPIVVVGRSSVSWDDFANASRRTESQICQPGEHIGELQNLIFLDDIRAKYKHFSTDRGERGAFRVQGHSLLELLFLTRNFQATDPRDKLFALVGLANDVHSIDWEVLPNYSLAASEVYHRFALWYITRRRNVEMFSFGVNRDAPPIVGLETLPSWVPDLTRPDMARPFPKLHYLSAEYIDIRYDLAKEVEDRLMTLATGTQTFHADLLPDSWHPLTRRTKFTPAHIAFSDGGAVIHVLGTQVGKIKSMGRPLENFKNSTNTNVDITNSTLEWTNDCWRVIVENSGEKHYDALGAETFEAAWQTMVCEMTDKGNRPWKGRYREAFRHLFERFQMLEGQQATSRLPVQVHEGGPLVNSGEKISAMARKASLKQDNIVSEVISSENEWYRSRCFGVVDSGHFAAVPKRAREGDVICLFDGGRVPYVLRPCDNGYFELVGECYVHGLMHGEGKADGVTAYRKQNFSIR
ncbi:heterokaryon incompatibility protein-domain-containing protein [Xylariaceae sp. FL0662B]|nr:heterokaryon incompatibility protein-domain-containing protein [Xylariaceae sp. FL0662B]